jgi:thiamine kinase-like enzyme
MLEKQLKHLFFLEKNKYPIIIDFLPPSTGSDKIFLKLDEEVLGVYNPNKISSQKYKYLTHFFLKNGINVPLLYQDSHHDHYYLVENLGTHSLFAEKNKEFYFPKVIQALKNIHPLQPRVEHFSQDIEKIFSSFFYGFLWSFQENKKGLWDEFLLIKEKVLSLPQNFCILKDCQSRNIYIKNEKIYFIDFQGARLGNPLYDLTSLLDQASLDLSDEFKNTMLELYLQDIQEKDTWKKYYIYYQMLRKIQVLGFYAYQGTIKKNFYFLQNIKKALHQLILFSKELPLLQESLHRIEKKLFTKTIPISLESFSFKRKNFIPKGTVFDCTILNNPGRNPELSNLNGKDLQIHQFFKDQSEELLALIFSTIDFYIKNYDIQYYKSLSLSFGCTGGKHRSVFIAEQVKIYLKEIYQIEANISHHEEKFWLNNL